MPENLEELKKEFKKIYGIKPERFTEMWEKFLIDKGIIDEE